MLALVWATFFLVLARVQDSTASVCLISDIDLSSGQSYTTTITSASYNKKWFNYRDGCGSTHQLNGYSLRFRWPAYPFVVIFTPDDTSGSACVNLSLSTTCNFQWGGAYTCNKCGPTSAIIHADWWVMDTKVIFLVPTYSGTWSGTLRIQSVTAAPISFAPTTPPTKTPTLAPSPSPVTSQPSRTPSKTPSRSPSTSEPSMSPSLTPTRNPTMTLTQGPTSAQSTKSPTPGVTSTPTSAVNSTPTPFAAPIVTGAPVRQGQKTSNAIHVSSSSSSAITAGAMAVVVLSMI